MPYHHRVHDTKDLVLVWVIHFILFLPNHPPFALEQTMEDDLADPSPAYTSVFTAEPASLEGGLSVESSVPSASTGLSLTPEHIKAHLRLLRAFQALKWRVQNPDSYPEVASKIPPRARSLNQNDRWIWFLQLAVERSVHLPRHSSINLYMWILLAYRFTRWVLKLDIARFVHPPIDVWMVWHSYMLNPSYARRTW